MLGAHLLPGGGVKFSVWAPRPREVSLRLGGADLPMAGDGAIWSLVVPDAQAGACYQFVLDGKARPDPRSRFQPEGVHGPSQVVDPDRYPWRSTPPVRGLADLVIYELHVGTFTTEGTYAAAAARLPDLVDVGVNAVELMPLATFPGQRNWGYDGVLIYAPCAAYGTPDDLRAFVDGAHRLGVTVLLDVVYNHLGPEGNYIAEYAPFYTPEHRTLWGDAPDFTRREVRDFIIDNARHWLREYHFDGLRLDAIQSIWDPSPRHVLAELCERARPGILIAETDENEVRIFDELGFDACWSDDFHHALHACLTGERQGYYQRFGAPEDLARAIESGWIRGPHPERSRALAPSRLVVASQTHDQIGNRARGDRLEHICGPASARLAAVVALAAAPAIPLLFMGEEYGAGTPFQYFTDHSDPDLQRAVSEGRRREFAAFSWQGEVPDPQDPATFWGSKLLWEERSSAAGQARLRLYRDLLALRRIEPDLGARAKERCRSTAAGNLVMVTRGDHLILLNLDERIAAQAPPEARLVLHSEDVRYGGALAHPGRILPGRSAAIYRR